MEKGGARQTVDGGRCSGKKTELLTNFFILKGTVRFAIGDPQLYIGGEGQSFWP